VGGVGVVGVWIGGVGGVVGGVGVVITLGGGEEGIGFVLEVNVSK